MMDVTFFENKLVLMTIFFRDEFKGSCFQNEDMDINFFPSSLSISQTLKK